MKQTIACFDFDGTMAPGDSIVPFLLFARKQGKLSLLGLLLGGLLGLLHACKCMDGGRAKKKAFSFYARLTNEEKQALDQAFAQTVLLPRVYAKAKEVLSEHQKKGHLVYLVTASTENYMRPVAQVLHCTALLATPLDETGKPLCNCHGEEKVRRLFSLLASDETEVDFAASYAYGDSRSDLPLLRLFGHAALINPKKRVRKAAPDLPVFFWKKG